MNDLYKYKLAITVGRFQSPYIHYGYVNLFNKMESIAETSLILVGAGEITLRSPLPYFVVMDFLMNCYGHKDNIKISHLPDCPISDALWAHSLIKLACLYNSDNEDLSRCVFVGGSDSYINTLKVFYPDLNYEIVERHPDAISSTKIRAEVKLPFIGKDGNQNRMIIESYIAGFNIGYAKGKKGT